MPSLNGWHIVQLWEQVCGALSKFLRRCIAKGLRISDRLQRLVQAHFYAQTGQVGRAALGKATDWLDPLSINDGLSLRV